MRRLGPNPDQDMLDDLIILQVVEQDRIGSGLGNIEPISLPRVQQARGTGAGGNGGGPGQGFGIKQDNGLGQAQGHGQEIIVFSGR